ncbi:MAG: Txe/YoeB family addiction module toxin [Treponema sp.]|nr:Txe/YoeB family addiction module toxin [Treponema sp.]
MNWRIKWSKRAVKDSAKIKAGHWYKKTKALIDVLRINPYQMPPDYEKLSGDLHGAYSRRINGQHRLVYAVDETEHAVKILSMWSHYE